MRFGNWPSRNALLVAAVTATMAISGCAGGSMTVVNSIGSKLYPANIDFSSIYLQAKRANIAYDSAKTIKAKYPMTVRVRAPSNESVLYFLERDDNRQEQIITVRGTDNDVNLAEDMNITVRYDRPIKIPVHEGFDRATRSIYADVKPYLKTNYKTYIVGHSLGGAVAAILAIYLIEDGVPVERVVTFGQPRFTTADGVKELGFLPLTRVVDENDIVPMVPPYFAIDAKFGPYEQVGPEVILLDGEDFVFLPLHDANRISIGEFWRTLTYDNVRDHHIRNYLKRISDKIDASKQVPYDDREKFILSDRSQATN
jgi:hypothetical protein